jgi:hypothetical protein
MAPPVLDNPAEEKSMSTTPETAIKRVLTDSETLTMWQICMDASRRYSDSASCASEPTLADIYRKQAELSKEMADLFLELPTVTISKA